MTRWLPGAAIVGAVAAALSGGCAPDSRIARRHFSSDPHGEANAEWRSVRAAVKQRLAQDAFDRGDLRTARTAADEAATLSGDTAATHLLRAQIELADGNLSAAREAAAAAQARAPQDANVAYVVGLIEERYEQPGAARDAFDRALTASPNDVTLLLASARARVEAGAPLEATEMVEARLTDFARNVELRSFLGATYRMLEMKEAAVRAYADAVQIDANDAALRERYGLTLEWAGQDDEALRVLRPLVAAAPATPEAAPGEPADLHALCRKALARASLRLGKGRAAIEAVRPVVAADGDDAEGWALMVRAAVALGDFSTGREAAQQLSRLDPTSELGTLVAAMCALRAGDTRTAMSDAAAALQRDPHDATALCVLAVIRQSKGDSHSAERLVRHALRVDPDCTLANALGTALRGPVADDSPAAEPFPVTSRPAASSESPCEEVAPTP